LRREGKSLAVRGRNPRYGGESCVQQTLPRRCWRWMTLVGCDSGGTHTLGEDLVACGLGGNRHVKEYLVRRP